MEARRVTRFQNASDQAVQVRREADLPDEEVRAQCEDGQLTAKPVATDGLLALLERLEPIEEEWPEIEDPLPEPVDL